MSQPPSKKLCTRDSSPTAIKAEPSDSEAASARDSSDSDTSSDDSTISDNVLYEGPVFQSLRQKLTPGATPYFADNQFDKRVDERMKEWKQTLGLATRPDARRLLSFRKAQLDEAFQTMSDRRDETKERLQKKDKMIAKQEKKLELLQLRGKQLEQELRLLRVQEDLLGDDIDFADSRRKQVWTRLRKQEETLAILELESSAVSDMQTYL